MARKLRVQYPGALYHVMNRGDRREPIFKSDADNELFLQTLGEACAKTGWQVHAVGRMGNHFHLVVETPRANLVAGMKWFLGTCTVRFTVLINPVITQQPLSHSVAPGSLVTLSVAITGNPAPFGYEWRRGTTPWELPEYYYRLALKESPFTEKMDQKWA